MKINWKRFCSIFARHLAFLGLTLAVLAGTAQGQIFSDLKKISDTPGAGAVQIAVDTAGNINVVWNQMNLSGYPGGIGFSRSSDGGVTFSAPKNISNNQLGGSHNIRIALDSAGNIYVVWNRFGPPGQGIYFTRSNDAGATFTTPKLVCGVVDTLWHFALTFIVDADGAINIVFLRDVSSATPQEILFVRSVDGGDTFSSPIGIHGARAAESPEIAVGAAGNINLVWWGSDGSGIGGIQFSRSSDGGLTFSTPTTLSASALWTGYPEMAMDSVGNINVIWLGTLPGVSGVFYSRSINGGATFTIPQRISPNRTDLSFYDPHLAVDTAGNIDVVWAGAIGGQNGISFTRSSNGGLTFYSPKVVSVLRELGVGHLRMAVDAAGNINVAWLDEIPLSNEGEFEYKTFFSRSGDGGATFLDSRELFRSPNTGSPELALDLSGNINLVWSEYLSGIYFLRARNITPRDAILGLINDVVNLNLKQGITNSLDAKLDAAVGALDDVNENNNQAAINTLQAFINAVQAQRGKEITEADADRLISTAQQIIAMLGG